MGYTHYWLRESVIEQTTFDQIVSDFRRLLPALDHCGVKLADGLGKGNPVLTNDVVRFNGAVNCGHPKNHNLVIPWPAPYAGGVNFTDEPIAGNWVGGSLLDTRTCNGDCSYETFSFPRIYKLELEPWMKPSGNLYFDCCKTAFRPYDLAVTAFLIIAKHHLDKNIILKTDGDKEHWFDARMLCQMELGYGMDTDLFDPIP